MVAVPSDREVILHRFPKQDTPFPLGRHVEHDSASRLFRFKVPANETTNSVLWGDSSPVLDQGNTSSCTGNASAQLLNTQMFAPSRTAVNKSNGWLTEKDALEIYSLGTHLDGFGPGQYYPPHDDGSSGVAVAKAMQQLGYIDKYLHCFDMPEVLAAIQKQPVIVGVTWTNQMFNPDSTGLVMVGPINNDTVAGGHEFMCRGVNFDKRLLHFRNSWGVGWGKNGEFFIGFEDFQVLLENQGDCVVPHGKNLP